MNADSMPPARGSSPPCGTRSPFTMRAACWWPVLPAACVLLAGGGDEERAALAPGAAASQKAPLAQGLTAQQNAPPPESIAILASPARPIEQADAAVSPAAQPLLPPVIHTVE